MDPMSSPADLWPDPDRGVFSTALVSHGEIVELKPHLRRLEASSHALYGRAVPAETAARAHEAAAGHTLARLRISLVPQAAGELALTIAVTPIDPQIVLPGADGAIALRSVEASGWGGAHKFNDRRLLEKLDAACAPDAALLCDREHGVLETTRANLFVVTSAGVLVTPPANGMILPGLARAAVLDLARTQGLAVREAPLAPAELEHAREAFMTGSVRGIEPVRALDATRLAAPGPLTAQLAQLLGAQWLGGRGRGQRVR